MSNLNSNTMVTLIDGLVNNGFIQLPSVSNIPYRSIMFKDITGFVSFDNTVSILANGLESIENSSSNYKLTRPYSFLSLYANASNSSWQILQNSDDTDFITPQNTIQQISSNPFYTATWTQVLIDPPPTIGRYFNPKGNNIFFNASIVFNTFLAPFFTSDGLLCYVTLYNYTRNIETAGNFFNSNAPILVQSNTNSIGPNSNQYYASYNDSYQLFGWSNGDKYYSKLYIQPYNYSEQFFDGNGILQVSLIPFNNFQY